MLKRMVIFSDLDGSLLDSRTYSFAQAAEALSLIRQQGVPLVLCSSKTRVELESCRKLLGNDDPFISENGGGVFIPQDSFPGQAEGEQRGAYRVIVLGTPYDKVRRMFIELRERLGIAVWGFGDMTPEEVAELTGLSPEEAKRAKQRDFDEPFIFEGVPDERFLQAIEGAGLRWTQGRYFHLMGNHHKGKAVNLLASLYKRQYKTVVTVGLGDSLNDLPFLLAVDKPVLIRREDGSHDPRIEIPGLYRTEQIGPAGWNEAVLRLLETGT
jgi:mannosyl-3-phosphoglycerate phosphatase family protein